MTPSQDIQIISFSNATKDSRKLLKRFVDFHWIHYKNDPQYVPLLDYEYLGFKLIGIHGFFEADNLFLKHAKMQFFLAIRENQVVGRCNAFVNHRHNDHWKDKVGFFGQFETIDDSIVSRTLTEAAAEWLKSHGMDRMRGPQNLPVNEATPGILTRGFDTRPVMYYHYNKPYYEEHLRKAGFKPVKRVLSWEYPVAQPFPENYMRLSEKVIKRYDLKFETWDQRPLDVRKREMLNIYNAAWNDNFGFVPFTEEEFFAIIDDMTLIMDKGLFIFVYKQGESAGFFGGVPNVTEKLGKIGRCRHCELLRAIRMLMGKNKTRGYRLGYLAVKPEYRKLGLDAVMLYKQKLYSEARGYEYADLGWVLDDNKMTIRIIERVGSIPSKTYTVFEKKL